jgi:glycerol-3-phosphate dehydrogenase subunit B
LNSFDEFVKTNPKHPYALIGFDVLDMATGSFMNLCEEHGFPYYGSLSSNFLLPTALGSIRPTCLAPGSMIAGDLRDPTPMLIVGFSQYLDFSPGLVAENLNAQGVHAKEFTLDLISLRDRKFISAMVLARLFDSPDFCTEVVAALKPRLGNVARVGFPAVLGLLNTPDVLRQLEEQLGLPVFEIPGLPPSIPGIRLHNIFTSAIQTLHGSINNGMSVTNAITQSKMVVAVTSEAAAKNITHPAKHFILATGGILGGGIIVNNDGYAQDTVFNIAIEIPPSPSDWFYDQFLSTESHPIHTKGLPIDLAFHPIDKADQLIYQNLYAAGNIIGNCDPIRECSVEGIALASGYKIVENISKGHMM